MSYTFTCDWCGEAIEGREYVELRARAGDDAAWRGGWAAHYHGGKEPNCYESVRDALDTIRGAGKVIESLPVARKPPRPEPASRKPVKGTSTLDEIELHPPSAAALRSAGIRTLEEAAECSEIELLGIERVAVGTVNILGRAMRARGLAFREGPSADELGQRIRRLREDAGLGRSALALALEPDPDKWGRRGIYESVVAGWERGSRAPKREHLQRLAGYFGVPIEHFTEVGDGQEAS